jgi:hypothetical protein
VPEKSHCRLIVDVSKHHFALPVAMTQDDFAVVKNVKLLERPVAPQLQRLPWNFGARHVARNIRHVVNAEARAIAHADFAVAAVAIAGHHLPKSRLIRASQTGNLAAELVGYCPHAPDPVVPIVVAIDRQRIEACGEHRRGAVGMEPVAVGGNEHHRRRQAAARHPYQVH